MAYSGSSTGIITGKPAATTAPAAIVPAAMVFRKRRRRIRDCILQWWAGKWIDGLGSAFPRGMTLNWPGRERASRKTATAFTTGTTINRDIQPGKPARWQMRQHPGNGAMMLAPGVFCCGCLN